MKIRKIYQGNLPENKIVTSETYSSTDTYSCTYLNSKFYDIEYGWLDGTGVFGWYTSATSGEDLTTNYDVTPALMRQMGIGTKWMWPSRVYTGGTNYGQVIYMTTYYGWAWVDDEEVQYMDKTVTMNGNYYEYCYDDTTVYKETYPSGGVACLTSETKVWTPEGSKPIKDIKVGDKVLSFNWCLDKADYYEVESISSHEEKDGLNITLENSDTITATKEHPFWTKDKGRVPANMLKKGSVLLDNEGNEYTVKSVRSKKINDTVYDLNLGPQIMNYYVGDDKIMVFSERIKREAA